MAPSSNRRKFPRLHRALISESNMAPMILLGYFETPSLQMLESSFTEGRCILRCRYEQSDGSCIHDVLPTCRPWGAAVGSTSWTGVADYQQDLPRL